MLEPGLTEKELEIQAAFMDLCMAARGYVFLPDCAEATVTYNPRHRLRYSPVAIKLVAFGETRLQRSWC